MTIIAIGGAEEKTGQMTVLKRMLAEAKGAESRVLIVTTATGYPEEVAQIYRDAFAALGVTPVFLHLTAREQANDPANVAKAKDSDLIFFSGGDQLKLATVLNGTGFLDAVKQRHDEGAVIAGTSAGAAAMSGLMIYEGDPAKAMQKGEVLLTDGFNFTPDAVFDTHFGARGRLPRLFNVVAASPAQTGLGLDEDTGVILRANGEFEVFGSGAVTVVDGSQAKSDIAFVERGEVFKVEGLDVRTLKAGEKFSLGKPKAS